MGPDDGLNQLLPVPSPGEQEHQAECPDEVSAQEQEPVATTLGPVRLDDLRCFRPQEVP